MEHSIKWLRANTPMGPVAMKKFIKDELNHSFSQGESPDLAIRNLAELIAHWPGSWSIGLRCEGASYYFTDPLGREQVYYRLKDGKVKSSIEDLAGDNPKFDQLYFSSAAKFGYHIGNRTYAEGIRQVEPSTILKVTDDGVISTLPYDSIRNDAVISTEGMSLEVAALMLRGLVTSAVKTSLDNLSALKTDKLYVLLSGGLDSSIMAYVVNTLKRKGYNPLKDVEVCYLTTTNGEDLKYARLLADRIGINLQEIELHTSQDDLVEAMVIADSPIDLGSLIPNYHLFKACGPRAKILTGDGPDELFGGYSRMQEYDSQFSDAFQELSYYHFPKLNATTRYYGQTLFCPYLDQSIVRFALGLPREYRTDKKVLREAFRSLIPDEIIDRPKYALKSDGPREGRLEYLRKCLSLFKEVKSI